MIEIRRCKQAELSILFLARTLAVFHGGVTSDKWICDDDERMIRPGDQKRPIGKRRRAARPARKINYRWEKGGGKKIKKEMHARFGGLVAVEQTRRHDRTRVA